MEALTFAMPVIAFGLGAYFGRKVSAIALACTLLAVAIASIATLSALSRSGLAGWAFAHDHPLPIALGLGFVLSALALIGPTVSKSWINASAISLVVVGLFVVTQFPMMFAACALFGACI